MPFTALRIAEQIHGEVIGDGSVELTGLASATMRKVATSPSPRRKHISLPLSKVRPPPSWSPANSPRQRSPHPRGKRAGGRGQIIADFFPPVSKLAGVHPGATIASTGTN